MSVAQSLKKIFSPPQVKKAFDIVPVGVQGKPQRPTADYASLLSAYTKNEVVYACIDVKANAMTDPRLIVERRSGTKWAEIEGHPMRRLMMRPNPLMHEAAFMRACIVSMDVYGEFYCEIVRRNGLPAQLWPINPAHLRPVPDAKGDIQYYEYRNQQAKVDIAARDMLVWRNYHPGTRYRGLSPLSVALGSVEGDTLQTDYVSAFFEGGGVPSGILTVKGRSVTADEANAIRSQWRAKFTRQAGVANTDIAVLDGNAEYQALGSKINELQSEELRSVTESRIAMALGVPPLIIYSYAGMMRATYSNLREAWESFWDSRLTPFLNEYRSWLTWSLLTQFESQELIYGERVRISHDLSSVVALQDNVDAMHRRANEALAAGGMLLSEYRSHLGLPRIDDTDYYIRPASAQIVPAVAVIETPTDDIQRAALNGTQTSALVTIVERVQSGALPPDAAIEIIAASFPAIDASSITRMIGAATTARDAASAASVVPAAPEAPTEEDAPTDEDEPKMRRLTPAQTKASRDSREQIENRAAKKIERQLKLQYEAGAENGPDSMDDGDAIASVMNTIYPVAMNRAFVDAGMALSMQLSFDLADERVKDVLSELLKKCRSIADTTKEEVRALIGRQAAEGWSVERLRDEILAHGAQVSKSRALTIARTETASAYTRSSILAYKESGVVEAVEWDSKLDEATTEVCKALHGKRTPLGSVFDGGFIGPPAHPNCRSALIPIVY